MSRAYQPAAVRDGTMLTADEVRDYLTRTGTDPKQADIAAAGQQERIDEDATLTIRWCDNSMRRTGAHGWYTAKRAALKRIAETALELGVWVSEIAGYNDAYEAAHAEEATAERQAMLAHRDMVRHDPDPAERDRQARANYGAWGRRKVKGRSWVRPSPSPSLGDKHEAH